MARKRGGPQLNKGPFSAKQLERALVKGDDWYRVPGAKHIALKHPAKRGKVNFSASWTSLKYGQETFRSVARQAGLTQRELLQLLNQWG